MLSFYFPSKEERQELISQLQNAENRDPASAEKYQAYLTELIRMDELMNSYYEP